MRSMPHGDPLSSHLYTHTHTHTHTHTNLHIYIYIDNNIQQNQVDSKYSQHMVD